MAKDYFQDILPPDETPKRRATSDGERRIPIRKQMAPESQESSEENDAEVQGDAPHPAQRSIRNIAVPERRRASVESAGYMVSPPRRGGARWLLWSVAGGSVIVLGILALVALRSTAVTVIPRSQVVTFDGTTQFTAYPSTASISGALSFEAKTLDLDDSEVVQSTGTVHASDKASGSITIYNNFSSSPVKFVATTRFQAANGLIFRTPAAIVVPGKSAAGPGTVTVTVVGDQAGDQYNVPAGKFTVPGLKGSAEFDKVYAQSSQPMTGGFIGDKPGVDDNTMSAAKAAIRGRLESKARDAISNTPETIILPDLVSIQYQDEAPTQEASGGVRIHETAHVSIPTFTQESFAAAIASSVAVSDAPLSFLPGKAFAANLTSASTTGVSSPLTFTLSGTGTLVWKVDSVALQKALAGKTQQAFQDVVKQFPSIQEAHARVEPFWSSTFPVDPSAIKVSIEPVTAAQ